MVHEKRDFFYYYYVNLMGTDCPEIREKTPRVRFVELLLLLFKEKSERA